MRRQLLPIGIFNLAYMAGFSVLALARGNGEFMFYAFFMVLIIAALTALHLRVHLSTLVLWLLSIWGCLHMAGGTLPLPEPWGILYNFRFIENGLKYDQVTHAYGFACATAACWEVLLRLLPSDRRPRIGIAIGAMLMGCGLGALNEVVEFGATLLIPETNVGGYVNTGWDLVSNLVGSSAAAIFLWHRSRPTGNKNAA